MKRKPENIVVFIRALISGGAEKQSLFLAKALQERYKVFVVVLKGDIIEEKHLSFIHSENINLVRLEGPIFKRLIHLYNLLHREKIDIIFSYLASDNFWGAIVGKLAGVRHRVGGLRNSVIKKSKLVANKFLHKTFQGYLIFNNHSGCEDFVQNKGFNAKKCYVIENCFHPVKDYYQRSNTKAVTLITVSRFVPQKGIGTLIYAINYLRNNHRISSSDFQVKIVGYGQLEKVIRKNIKDNKLEKYIKLVIKPDNLEQHYKDSDLYVCTSWYEGLSNTILEAMGASLPIIATNVGDNSRLVAPEKNGFLFECNDYKKLAEHILTLLNSENKRTAFGLSSYNQLKNNYTFKIFQQKYFEFIENL